MKAATTRQPQISALQRIAQLPPLFRGSDLTVRFGWTSRRTSHYLYLWSKRGLIEPLGGRSDVYAITLPGPKTSDVNWYRAADMAMPGAVLTGLDVLRQHGWITQIVHKPQLAVSTRGPVFELDRFEVTSRTQAWFSRYKPGMHDPGHGLLVLSAPYALLDMIEREGSESCGIQTDDVDWDAISEDDRETMTSLANSWQLDLGQFEAHVRRVCAPQCGPSSAGT